ncbi:MAG: hypothetical protein IKO39_05295, partial [Treponema sp.]|nr:hypothetical protein [Treponema sp.]
MINNINVLIELLNSLIDKITFPVIKVLEKLITFLLSFSKYLPKYFDVLPRFSGGLMIIVGLLICFLIMKMFNKYENRYVRFAGKYKGKSNKYQIFNSSDLPEYITSLRYEKDGWISVESGSRCVYKGGGVYSIQAGTGISSEGGEKYKPVFLADHPIYIYVREGDSKEILNTNEYKAKEF